MSLILKSNTKLKSSNFPNIKQVVSTTGDWFNNYKSRVLADGGEITSESKVRDAISFLFKNNLIGRLSCCASPYYGVKKNASGEVLKLYSLDGEDLVSEVLGTGSHPVITSDGYLEINPDVTDITTVGNRGVIRTENKVNLKKSKQIGYGTVFKSTETTARLLIQCFSTWESYYPSSSTREPSIDTTLSGWGTESKVIGKDFANPNSATIAHKHDAAGRGGFVIRLDADSDADNFQLYNADMLFRKSTVAYDPDMYELDFHIIYGGNKSPIYASHNTGTRTLLSCMWFIDDLSGDAAVEITKFISRNYTELAE